MNKLKIYLKHELDVDFFSMANAMGMVMIFGFLVWLDGKSSVLFATMIQMCIAAYVSSWIQKLIFIKERVYKRWEYRIRVIAWNVIPILFVLALQIGCDWFAGCSTWTAVTFDISIIAVYPTEWWFIHVLYRESTDELNTMLSDYKKRMEE